MADGNVNLVGFPYASWEEHEAAKDCVSKSFAYTTEDPTGTLRAFLGAGDNPVKEFVFLDAANAANENDCPLFFTPEEFGALADGVTDDSAAIQEAMNAAALSGGPKIVAFCGKTYRIENSLTAVTGVTLHGRGIQGTKILCGSAMNAMIEPQANFASGPYFRFSICDLWLDGNNLANMAVNLQNSRTGFFARVFTSGCLLYGWNIGQNSYYNTFYRCEEHSPNFGWNIVDSLGLGPNENHFYSCRKNVGVTGWNIQALNASINQIKLTNCICESQSGQAIVLNADNGNTLENLVIEGFREDSSVAGSGSINIVTADVIGTHLTDIYSTSVVINNGTNTIFTGFPFEKVFDVVIDFPAIAAQAQEVIPIPLAGVSGVGWIVVANPAGGGAFSTGLNLEYRVDGGTDQISLIAHNKTNAVFNPESQRFIGKATRIL